MERTLDVVFDAPAPMLDCTSLEATVTGKRTDQRVQSVFLKYENSVNILLLLYTYTARTREFSRGNGPDLY